MKASQLGLTEGMLNVIGYHIDHDPSPILFLMPILDLAAAVSKDRIVPMLRDTPCLRGRVHDDVKTKKSGSTILHKTFQGGHLTLAGANSPASLASRPVRVVLADEVDRYPLSAGGEGSPKKLAYKRASNFWNRKLIEGSTPTIRGKSEIEGSYEASDQGKFWLPCPHCKAFQVLKWSQVTWPGPSNSGRWHAPEHHPEKAVYLCEHCHKELSDADKLRILPRGEWRFELPFAGVKGFWISGLYSPWLTWGQMAADFLEAKKKGAKEMQVFINTVLAETWDEGQEGEQLDQNQFYARRETYGPEIPAAAIALTAAADIQDDRIECEVKAWGKGEENWGIEAKIFYGATTDPNAGAFKSLDDYLLTTFRHASGAAMTIACTAIDAGHRTQEVYAFVRTRAHRRIFAVKGSKDPARPIVHRASRDNVAHVLLFLVGTDTAKATIYSRLKLSEPGPGFFHWHQGYDLEYFEQLTAEKIVTTYHKGFAKREWVKIRARNEALDLTVYNLAAITILGINLDQSEPPKPADAVVPEAERRGGGWMKREAPAPRDRGRGGWMRRSGR